MEDCFKLLHFHQGSQITNIRHIKGALNEAARVYTELKRLGAGLEYLDVGGGLGVDYDGSQTNFESSVNYTLQEYANDVVYHVQKVCDDAGVPHPNDHLRKRPGGRGVSQRAGVRRAGRLGAGRERHSAVDPARSRAAGRRPDGDVSEHHRPQPAGELPRRPAGAGHGDEPVQRRLPAAGAAVHGRKHVLGDLPQDQASCAGQLEFMPEELEVLDSLLSDTYFCNFSLFQSIPDSWAIKQLFPIMPIHRLRERPTRHAVIGDITCDSDGKIDQFIDRRDVKRTLPLHSSTAGRITCGAFMIGAYQEILGDLHNLFGDTNAVHVSLDDTARSCWSTSSRATRVREVLDYVEFEPDVLIRQLRDAVEVAVRDGRISYERSRPVLEVLRGGPAGLHVSGRAGSAADAAVGRQRSAVCPQQFNRDTSYTVKGGSLAAKSR